MSQVMLWIGLSSCKDSSYAMKSQVLLQRLGSPSSISSNCEVYCPFYLWVMQWLPDDDSVHPIQVYTLPTGLIRLHRDDGFC